MHFITNKLGIASTILVLTELWMPIMLFAPSDGNAIQFSCYEILYLCNNWMICWNIASPVVSCTGMRARKYSLIILFLQLTLTTTTKFLIHDRSVDSSTIILNLFVFIKKQMWSLAVSPVTLHKIDLIFVRPHLIFFAIKESEQIAPNSSRKWSIH